MTKRLSEYPLGSTHPRNQSLIKARVKCEYGAYILNFGDRDLLIQDSYTADELNLDECETGDEVWVNDEYYNMAEEKEKPKENNINNLMVWWLK